MLERLEDVRTEQEDGFGLLDQDDLDDQEGDGDEWTPAVRAGFDGPDDPLLRYDPEAIDRRAINVSLKAEFDVDISPLTPSWRSDNPRLMPAIAHSHDRLPACRERPADCG